MKMIKKFFKSLFSKNLAQSNVPDQPTIPIMPTIINVKPIDFCIKEEIHTGLDEQYINEMKRLAIERNSKEFSNMFTWNIEKLENGNAVLIGRLKVVGRDCYETYKCYNEYA